MHASLRNIHVYSKRAASTSLIYIYMKEDLSPGSGENSMKYFGRRAASSFLKRARRKVPHILQKGRDERVHTFWKKVEAKELMFIWKNSGRKTPRILRWTWDKRAQTFSKRVGPKSPAHFAKSSGQNISNILKKSREKGLDKEAEAVVYFTQRLAEANYRQLGPHRKNGGKNVAPYHGRARRDAQDRRSAR